MDLPQFFNNVIRRKKIRERDVKIDQQNEAFKIQGELVDRLKQSFYFNIDKIQPEHAFQYIIAIIIAVYLVTRVSIALSHILGLFVGIITCYYFFSKRDIYESSDKDQLEIKLKLIYPPPQYFDIHPDLVRYFYNIREFRNYNPPAYDTALHAVDDFIHIYRDIVDAGVIDCDQNVDVAVNLIQKAVNNIHSVIFTTPIASVTHDKLERSLEVLYSILKNYLDEMVSVCNDQYRKTGSPKKIYLSPVKAKVSKSKHLPFSGFDYYA